MRCKYICYHGGVIVAIAVATFCSTILGGLFALRLRDKLHLILGFSAGAVIGVAFFDLMPEALQLGSGLFSMSQMTALIALGFLIYLALDQLVVHHRHEEDDKLQRGRFGAGTLSLHSVLDGVGIGFAFQLSASVGLIVALAVVAHDFSDGINTVNFILKSNGNRAQAFFWLLIDAIAPVVGVLATMLVSISQRDLALVLALFAGFFLYIGASDLVPESHHEHPTRWTSLSTILGAAFLYVIIHFAA